MTISIPFSKIDNPKTVPLTPGNYLIELWGAEGGSWDSTNYGGKGAYTEGILSLHIRTNLSFYIGEKGSTITRREGKVSPTFNGGGAGYLIPTGGVLSHYGSSGGGATDVRTIKGVWNNTNSLKSRIMVAAGAGGATYNSGPKESCVGGYGGSKIGGFGVATGSGTNIDKAVGGHQDRTGSTGGKGQRCSGETGKLGIGGNGGLCFSTSGGGGGYYGGGGSGVSNGNHQCGAGGSFFISGLHSTDIKKLKFIRGRMLAGNSIISEPDGRTRTGHVGNGYARITKLSSLYTKQRKIWNPFLYSIIILITLKS